MKVLHVVQNYAPSMGGTQVLFQEISERLIKEYKDEVEVFTTDGFYSPHITQEKKIKPLNDSINTVIVKRFSFFQFHLKAGRILNRASRFLFKKRHPLITKYLAGPWSPALKKAIDHSDADVIGGASSGYMYMLYPLYRQKLKNPKPFVFQGSIHFQETQIEHNPPMQVLKAIKASEYYIANTGYEKEKLMSLQVPEENIVVVGCGVDIDAFERGNRNCRRKQMGIAENEILLGYVGRIEPTKSIDVLIDAFTLAIKKKPGIKLLIAGFKSEYANTLLQQVAKLPIDVSRNIIFQFNFDRDEKINLYHAMDMLVQPSTYESFGIVFLEAWSCKKPVIGAAIGAIKSLIDEEINGLLMEPDNSESLAEKILQLSDDKVLRLRLGENGYVKTKNNYTWQIITKKYRDVYLMAIKKFNKGQQKNTLHRNN